MLRKLVSTLAVVLGLTFASSAVAGPIATATWYLGEFSALGGAVTGAGPGGGAVNPGAPAWTFTIADDHVLTVIDCCTVGDAFEVFDGASSLGTTTVGSAGGGCVTAVACDTNPLAGRGDFLLAAGTYSITMSVAAYIGVPGNVFFIVRDVSDRVPEPGTLALLGLGLAGLAATRRRAR